MRRTSAIPPTALSLRSRTLATLGATLAATLALFALSGPPAAARTETARTGSAHGHGDLTLQYPPDPDAGMRGFAPPLTVRGGHAGRGGRAPMTLWLMCDSPRGIYPQVPTCDVPWRTIPAPQ